MGWDCFRGSEGLATERDKIYFRRLGYTKKGKGDRRLEFKRAKINQGAGEQKNSMVNWK